MYSVSHCGFHDVALSFIWGCEVRYRAKTLQCQLNSCEIYPEVGVAFWLRCWRRIAANRRRIALKNFANTGTTVWLKR